MEPNSRLRVGMTLRARARLKGLDTAVAQHRDRASNPDVEIVVPIALTTRSYPVRDRGSDLSVAADRSLAKLCACDEFLAG